MQIYKDYKYNKKEHENRQIYLWRSYIYYLAQLYIWESIRSLILRYIRIRILIKVLYI
jgi:hypothetical protein